MSLFIVMAISYLELNLFVLISFFRDGWVFINFAKIIRFMLYSC